MKIGLLIYGSLDTVTGGFIYDRYLVDYLESQGDQIEIVSLPWRDYARHLADNFSKTLRDRLLALEVDLLIQDELCHPSLIAINHHIIARVEYPIIALVHHLRSSEQHSNTVRWLYRIVEQRYLNAMDGFIFNSKTTRAAVNTFISRLPPHVVAYPGGNRFGNPISENHIHERAIQIGPLRVCFLGSITRRKQPHVILEACSLLPEIDIELSLIGNPHHEPRYSRQVHKMIPALPNATKVKTYPASDTHKLRTLFAEQHLLVVPSTYEGFGIVYLEGMAFGLPAIATTSGAAHETICHNRNGFLIEAGNRTALAMHLRELAMDRQKLFEMSKAALHTYQRGPTWEGMGKRVDAFLHSYSLTTFTPS